jgi:hypothetical protein
MKKSILLVCVLFAGLVNLSYAYDKRYDLNNSYNLEETNPSNYQRNEGYGLTRLN